jgi:hypothetical protein
MDYEADYTADDDVSDDDTADEPRHSFTQEVRNLFGVSLVTDLGIIAALNQFRRIFPPLKKLLFEAFWFVFALAEIVRFLRSLL